MTSDKRSNAGSGSGRERLLEAAANLLAEAKLADLLMFVGVRAVAAAAGVAPGTASYHFPGSSGGGKSNADLATEAVRHAIKRRGWTVTEGTVEKLRSAIPDLRAGDPDVLRRIADAAAADILDQSDPALDTALYAAVAVAPRDAAARAILQELYTELADRYSSVYPELADATDRRFVREISPAEFALAMTALADGFMIRQSFDPRPGLPELFAEIAIRLFTAATVDRAVMEEPTSADLLVPLPPGSNLDPHKRQAIATAAAETYDGRHRWEDVTIGSVAQRAGVNRATVTANFGDRSGLAAIIWARYVPSVKESIKRDRASGKSSERLIWSYVQRIAEIARIHYDLTAAFLEGVFSFTVNHGPPNYDNPADPRTLVQLPLVLADELTQHGEHLKGEFVDTPTDALTFAAFVTNTALLMTMTRRGMSSSQVADYVEATIIRGAIHCEQVNGSE